MICPYVPLSLHGHYGSFDIQNIFFIQLKFFKVKPVRMDRNRVIIMVYYILFEKKVNTIS